MTLSESAGGNGKRLLEPAEPAMSIFFPEGVQRLPNVRLEQLFTLSEHLGGS
jgi:hypothetical protein